MRSERRAPSHTLVLGSFPHFSAGSGVRVPCLNSVFSEYRSSPDSVNRFVFASNPTLALPTRTLPQGTGLIVSWGSRVHRRLRCCRQGRNHTVRRVGLQAGRRPCTGSPRTCRDVLTARPSLRSPLRLALPVAPRQLTKLIGALVVLAHPTGKGSFCTQFHKSEG